MLPANSAGKTVEDYLRVVRVDIDALGSLEDALARVPKGMRAEVRRRYEEETALPIRRAHVLSTEGGTRTWFKSWRPAEGFYWRWQRQYLIDVVKWSPHPAVESIDDATDRILSHLEDPRPTGPSEFDVRGLVMGYVQSGKTANYCALAAKAADVGYKLVVVLSGVHNSLRQQTQRRIERALGIKAHPLMPRPEFGRRWVPLTSDDLHGDFRADTIGSDVLQGNDHVVMVVKKNKTVLDRVINWMRDSIPPWLPVLVIDDEADQASINTGGNRPPIEAESDLTEDDMDSSSLAEELDPSVINGRVRHLLTLFRRVSYVAYTATPYANVFVHHEAIDRDVSGDIYPRDFIISLPEPIGYVGPERLFGRDDLPGDDSRSDPDLDVVELVPDHDAELLLPAVGEVEEFTPTVVPSLRMAVIDFVLSAAAVRQRVGPDSPASMLVHVHHRVPVQSKLGAALREAVAELRRAWKYDRDATRGEYLARWEARFRPVIVSIDLHRDCEFGVIEPFVDEVFRSNVPVVVLNSSSEDVLDYEADPSKTVIVVGGNRLSRGLTLERLLVSYFVRAAAYYDTLMQMGRWFGFKEQYADLTRIWITPLLAEWFRDIALAEEELRREIAKYERENLTPLHFGPKIRCHPAMMITARNKMGSATRIRLNYSGYLLQTTSFRLDDRVWLEQNLAAGAALITSLGEPDANTGTAHQPTWHGVPWPTIEGFLRLYAVDPRSPFDVEAIRVYVQQRVRHGELVRWWVSLRGRPTYEPSLGTEAALAPRGVPVNLISRTRLKSVPKSIGSLISPATLGKKPGSGDEEVGLTDDMLREARDDARSSGDLPTALRSRRDKAEGLLLLYPISRFSKPSTARDSRSRRDLFDDPSQEGCTVLGMSMVFPVTDDSAAVEYEVGSVGQPGDEYDGQE